MNLSLWKKAGLLGSMAAALGGCAQPTAENTFTVRKIESLPARSDGTVRIKLTTPGDLAEADESLIVRYVQIIAVREATQRQREVAAARGRATARKIGARPATHGRKQSRYLAVKTEPSAAPRGKSQARESVMIWDTQTQEIVGNKVYDLGTTPSPGTLARFETYTAEYVGSGL